MFLITRATVLATVTVQASYRVLFRLSEFCCSSVSLLHANLVVCASHSQRLIRRPDSDSSSTRNSEFDGMECDSKARGRAPSAYRDWCPSLLGLNTSCQQQYKQRPAYRDWCPALPGQRLSVPKDLGRAGQQPAGGRPALGLSPRLTPFPQSRAAPRDWHGRGGQVRWVTAANRQLAAARGRHRLPGRAVSPPDGDSER